MKFSVVIPVLNQHDATKKYVQSWLDTAKNSFQLLFIDNASNEPLAEQSFIREWAAEYDIKVLRNDKNVGVYPTFQQGYELTDSDFIFYSHNDVEMREYGWDVKLVDILERLDSQVKVGVCGMYGAKGIGVPGIYKKPYHFSQLRRWNCVTVESMAITADGNISQSDKALFIDCERDINFDYERVAVLDGFSLIVSRKMVAEAMNGKFDYETYPVHHMYDHDICIASHYGGFHNYVININCKHHGGHTSTKEKWAEDMGTTDLAIHRKAHEVFYKKWHGKLPVGVA